MGRVSHCSHGSLTSSYGWTIQVLLATLAFACLIIKRFCEPLRYRRSWLIWLFDTSKQGFGAIVVHFSNIILAELFEGPDPCTLYIISFLLDSSLGLLIIYCGIRLTQALAIRYNYDYLVFGEYGKPNPQLKYWMMQCVGYVVIVLLEKSVVTLLLQIKFWNNVKDFILWPVLNQQLEVLLVVLVIPFFVNVLMFWVTDNFLIMHRMHSLKNFDTMNSSATIFPESVGQRPARSRYDDDAELIDISFEPDCQSITTLT